MKLASLAVPARYWPSLSRGAAAALIALGALASVTSVACAAPPATAGAAADRREAPRADAPKEVAPKKVAAKDDPGAEPKEKEKEAPNDHPGGAPAAAVKDGEFIEYRYLPELGQIIFSDNSVRGAKRVEYLKQHADELARKGIYACSDESKRHVYRQSQKVGDRQIDSAVIIDPPTHQEDNGDYFTARLLVKVDGRKKIDCTIGTTADGELWVNKVVLHPEDGSVEIRALSGDGEELSIPESQESLDDAAVITDDSFYADDPAEPRPGPVKA